jgi:hypothetical protein
VNSSSSSSNGGGSSYDNSNGNSSRNSAHILSCHCRAKHGESAFLDLYERLFEVSCLFLSLSAVLMGAQCLDVGQDRQGS